MNKSLIFVLTLVIYVALADSLPTGESEPWQNLRGRAVPPGIRTRRNGVKVAGRIPYPKNISGEVRQKIADHKITRKNKEFAANGGPFEMNLAASDRGNSPLPDSSEILKSRMTKEQTGTLLDWIFADDPPELKDTHLNTRRDLTHEQYYLDNYRTFDLFSVEHKRYHWQPWGVSSRDFEYHNPYKNISNILLRDMLDLIQDMRVRVRKLWPLRLRSQYTVEFEVGYLIQMIQEKYRMMCDIYNTTEYMRYRLYNIEQLIYLEMVERHSFEVEHFINMLHETERKYGVMYSPIRTTLTIRPTTTTTTTRATLATRPTKITFPPNVVITKCPTRPRNPLISTRKKGNKNPFAQEVYGWDIDYNFNYPTPKEYKQLGITQDPNNPQALQTVTCEPCY